MSRTFQLSPIEAHALWAPTYDHAPNPILSLEERCVTPLLPSMAGMDVLDVACGTGRWLERLLRRGAATAAGLDLSREMLRQAQGKPELATRLVQADAMEMPLRTKSLDFAICSFGLSYVTDIGRFAEELARVVRNQGSLVLTDLHPSAQARGWKRSFRHDGGIVEVSSFQRSMEDIRETFGEEGFEPLACLEPAVGEAERPIFEKAGKADVFEEVRGLPTIVVFMFRLRGKSLIRPFGPPSPGGRRTIFESIPLPPGEGAPKGRVRDLGDPNSPTWLIGGRIALDARTTISANIEIADGRIRRIIHEQPLDRGIATIDLHNYLLLPGLINSHDHLELNLFPRLGRGPYPNAADWARDIYQPERTPVREHLCVPKTVRLWWGGLKNLLSGVTTVCHHNPYDPTFDQGFPVQVVRRYGWAHSTTFEKDVFRAFASTEPSDPFIIHAGEGTDHGSADEVFELDRIGALNHRTVLVHGVAFSEAGHALREQRGASLVWCPTSNRFVLGSTLNIDSIGNIDRVVLGSDSALTASGSLIEEIRAAREEGAHPNSIYGMVTETPASILRLQGGEGRIQPGAIANIIAIPWTAVTPAEALIRLEISQIHMVMVSGRIHLASDEFIARCHASEADGLESIEVDGLRRWVRAPIRWLMKEATAHLGNEIRLAGMRISA